ncbi:alpha/beta fold hydrolase [Bradyrhizobium sp. CCBAU 53421]|uniref:alpha/beta fold hydrolase n=1 Tax=Bradyrhizobium sp. CCBAU 53421 TaxID=1325120 RepID=UPI00188A34D5|nr:alpha/beta hydrolase [Bradyrhizobium sp. CCBAU 53421]QOZ33503.1 alpha/beta hydrolase [Bradyrhizobium sp. CCBAU 53421]
MDRRLFLATALFGVARIPRADALERWQTLPATPAPIAGRSAYAEVNGISLFHVETGEGSPVVFLHGGLSNSDYFGLQVPEVARRHRVICADSRGHGRSGRNAQPFGYDLMTDDVVALLDYLKIPRAAIVGWSDGAIIGLDMAMRHPDRVTSVFAFGANTQASGLKPDIDKNPTFAQFIARAKTEYERLSPTPGEYDQFLQQIEKMWDSQPNWTDEQLRTIRAPVLIADGQYDEGIRREHTEYMAATIPGAGLLILPNASHFAFLQDPALFNAALLDFLGS